MIKCLMVFFLKCTSEANTPHNRILEISENLNINGNISQEKINEINHKISEAYTNNDFTKINYDENGVFYDYFLDNSLPVNDNILKMMNDFYIQQFNINISEIESDIKKFSNNTELLCHIFYIDCINSLDTDHFKEFLKLSQKEIIENKFKKIFDRSDILCLYNPVELNKIDEFKKINNELNTYNLNIRQFFILRDQRIAQEDLVEIQENLKTIIQTFKEIQEQDINIEIDKQKQIISNLRMIAISFLYLSYDIFSVYKKNPDNNVIQTTNTNYLQIESSNLNNQIIQKTLQNTQDLIQEIEKHIKTPFYVLITKKILIYIKNIKCIVDDAEKQKGIKNNIGIHINQIQKTNDKDPTPLLVALLIVIATPIFLIAIKYNSGVKNLDINNLDIKIDIKNNNEKESI